MHFFWLLKAENSGKKISTAEMVDRLTLTSDSSLQAKSVKNVDALGVIRKMRKDVSADKLERIDRRLRDFDQRITGCVDLDGKIQKPMHCPELICFNG